jgi:hypothetical protein
MPNCTGVVSAQLIAVPAVICSGQYACSSIDTSTVNALAVAAAVQQGTITALRTKLLCLQVFTSSKPKHLHADAVLIRYAYSAGLVHGSVTGVSILRFTASQRTLQTVDKSKCVCQNKKKCKQLNTHLAITCYCSVHPHAHAVVCHMYHHHRQCQPEAPYKQPPPLC